MVRLESAQKRYGDVALVLMRPLPVLAEASALFAGVSAMPPLRFLVVVGTANAGIAVAYAYVGAFAADVDSFLLAVAGAFGLPLLALLAVGRRVDPVGRPESSET